MFGMIRAYARSLSVNQEILEKTFYNDEDINDKQEENNEKNEQSISQSKADLDSRFLIENEQEDVFSKKKMRNQEVFGKSKSFRGNKELGFECKRNIFAKLISFFKSRKLVKKQTLKKLHKKNNLSFLKSASLVVAITLMMGAFFGLTSPSRADTSDLKGITLAKADSSESYYTVYDYNDKEKVIFVKGDGVNVGDEYLSAENKLYEIVSVDNKSKIGYAEFIQNEELPKFNVRKAEESKSQAIAEVNKKVGVYHTHNDESYLDQDGTDSVYGKGGIHNVGARFVKNLKALGINVVYREDLHLPHNSGAYTRSQVTASAILDTGNIDALFDVHRDSTPRSEYVTEVDGTPMTKVRMVVGSANANYYENKEFAYAIKAYADEVYPNFIKDIYMGKGNYNQQLLSRGMLFEMGCEKIEKEYALRSTEPLAKILDVVLYGSKNASTESTSGLEFVDSNGQKSVVTGIVSKKSTASISFIWILLSGIAFYFVVLGIVCIFSKTTRQKVARFFKELIPIKR
ncbi:MAG: stage II sporulation protein P [Clostridia bacterium]|nr:stage II sporulation protein P [Clostridia bacterium]